MNIGRVLAGVFAVALCVALTGCASGSSSAGSSAQASSGSSQASAASASASESSASVEQSVSDAATASTSASASTSVSTSASATSASDAATASTSASATSVASSAAELANGEYTVTFDTDSNMFHVNEADEGKGVLTVSDEGMTVHIRLVSKKITKLYAGTADEAEADAAGAIEPTTDTVTYSDGEEEEVYGFDVPVPALDTPFDVAILGSKDKWYDHKVTVSDPVSN